MGRRTAVGLTAITLTFAIAPAPALAISYNSAATKAAFAWAKHKHPPMGATYLQAQCFPAGQHASVCRVSFEVSPGVGVLCQISVRVSGLSHTVRETDTTC